MIVGAVIEETFSEGGRNGLRWPSLRRALS
jgi:hypothetical protein